MTDKQTAKGHLCAFITILIWGTTFISTKVLLKSMTPIEILFFRFIIGFITLLCIYPHRMRIVHKKHELTFAAAGLCGITLYYLLENIALTFTSASNVGVIISAAPFFTALGAHLFLSGERLKGRFFTGFIAAMAGILLISINGSENLHLNPKGDMLALLAAAVWAAYSILSRKISAYGYHTIQATRRTFFYGLIFMVPALFFMDFHPKASAILTGPNLLNLLFLGLGASALCFVTWNLAVKRLGAVKTAAYIYMVPVITIITSVLILNEPVTWLGLLGAALTIAGLFISQK